MAEESINSKVMKSLLLMYLQQSFSDMMKFLQLLPMVALLLLTVAAGTGGAGGGPVFADHYQPLWGEGHLRELDGGSSVQLWLDPSSGSGFISKMRYGSGFFQMDIKLPDNHDTHGVLPTFYLTSKENLQDQQDEVDFEFVGNDTLPFVLHTNVYVKGIGGREQRIALWFDPRAEYHSYRILWNSHQIVLFIDGMPARVFRNTTKLFGGYPSQLMSVQATIWHGVWASGGRPTNWSQSPFVASYRGFQIDGCSLPIGTRNNCFGQTSSYWWEAEKYWQLSPGELTSYRDIRRKYLVYDYCSDAQRYPVAPPECEDNQ